MEDWCTIESDPGLFTDLIKGIGVKDVQVEELYSLDDQNLLDNIKPIYGLIFLFKWKKETQPREVLKYYDNDLFFADQVIQNACATQALLSILLNVPGLDIGQELKQLKEFSVGLDSQMKGLTISNSELIRDKHNSYKRDNFFEMDDSKKKSGDGDVFHFISYLPFKGKLYELDGLQGGPILLGDVPLEGDGWLNLAKEEIGKRILKYSQEETHFNLMAICQDIRSKCHGEIKLAEKNKLATYNALVKGGLKLDGMQEGDEEDIKSRINEQDLNGFDLKIEVQNDLLQNLQNQSSRIGQLNLTISDENQKFEKYQIENIRRRHQYIPLILELLKITAQKGKLNGLVEEAKLKKKEKQQNTQQKK